MRQRTRSAGRTRRNAKAIIDTSHREDKGIEAWVCHSTISMVLCEAWEEITRRRLYVFIAQSSPMLKEGGQDSRSIEDKKGNIRPYCLTEIARLALLSILMGSRLRLRVPHLNRPVCTRCALALAWIGVIRLELYDDGFLGVIEKPTVSTHLKPVFSSICSWNIEGWKLSSQTRRCIFQNNSNRVFCLSIEDICRRWRGHHGEISSCSLIVVEAKYMDYSYLSTIGEDSLYSTPCLERRRPMLMYIEHPSSLKKNPCWPLARNREFVRESPIERFLFSAVTSDCHIVTGMTSSVILLCDLSRKGVLPSFALTLLLSTDDACKNHHSLEELLSFIQFIKNQYSSAVRLAVFLDGLRLE